MPDGQADEFWLRAERELNEKQNSSDDENPANP
jgi:hypothetical protein